MRVLTRRCPRLYPRSCPIQLIGRSQSCTECRGRQSQHAARLIGSGLRCLESVVLASCSTLSSRHGLCHPNALQQYQTQSSLQVCHNLRKTQTKLSQTLKKLTLMLVGHLCQERFDSDRIMQILHVNFPLLQINQVYSGRGHSLLAHTIHRFYFLLHARLRQLVVQCGDTVAFLETFFNYTTLPEQLRQVETALCAL